jgi:hypothetical protein
VRCCVGRRLVRRYLISRIVLLRCSFNSSRKIIFSQLQIQSMIWASALQIRKHEYSGDFNFIKLFVVDILPLYAINSDAVSLFADSSFTFLAKLNMWLYLMYLSIWMNKYYFIYVKKKLPSIRRYTEYMSCTYRLRCGVYMLCWIGFAVIGNWKVTIDKYNTSVLYGALDPNKS